VKGARAMAAPLRELGLGRILSTCCRRSFFICAVRADMYRELLPIPICRSKGRGHIPATIFNIHSDRRVAYETGLSADRA